ncbi:MAG: glycine betaine ABC transporter substrate-binding protein [Thermoanaerobacterales bacterium]|nr:glycine betaine ABC transporter substrate-binding protein [Thermoanaerobacterales bacterium]
MKKRLWRRIALVVALAFAVVAVGGCGGGTQDAAKGGKVTVGSKNFTENIVMGEMLAQLIEAKTDLQVERKLNLGGTLVCWEALKKGDLDLYPDYTGTGLMAILKHDVMYDPDEVYNLVQKEYNEKYKIKWMQPLGFNNTYATAVKQELAQEYNLEKTSDLVPYAKDLVFGAEQEFLNRKDGYPGYTEAYGLKFKDVKGMETALKYQAIGEGKVDVIDAFSTDGELISYKLKILEDDKGFFPPYYCVPIVRMDTLEKYPELEEVLNTVAGQISDEDMQQLNYQVKEQGKKPAEVVEAFLKERGVI